jgi:hypothetical protein
VDADRIAQVVIGLSTAVGLAVVLALPPVKALQDRLGVTVLVSTGLPFLLLGVIFSLPSVGVLSADVLADLTPIFDFGLGWVGFVVGMQFDVRRLETLPRALPAVIVSESLAPMITTFAFCAAAYAALTDLAQIDRGILRDAIILAACAAPSAAVSLPFLTRRMGERGARILYEATLVDEVACLAALGLCAVFFRPGDLGGRWDLPAGAWLLLSLGLGGVLGIMAYLLIRGAESGREEVALLLGAVALSAGMAGNLGLQVPVICAIAGALLANLPLQDPAGLRAVLEQVERPIYLVFLLVVGAMWHPGDWQGWALAPVFVFARVLGKHLGALVAHRVGPAGMPPAREMVMALIPQSQISIVAMVSAAGIYGPEEARLGWATTAVIVGGVLTELTIRLLQRSRPPSVPPPDLDATRAVTVPARATASEDPP